MTQATPIPLSDQTKQHLIDLILPKINDLIEKKIIQSPFSGKKYTPESKTVKEDHRNTILQRGRPDFENDTTGVSGLQKTDLYCFYYFQMHFSSSALFYLEEKNSLKEAIKNKVVYFIDIGCGPFTSGMAFNSWMSQFADMDVTSVNYIGMDISNNMLIKAKELSSNIQLNYKNIKFTDNKKSIFELLDLNKETETLIILNYSYLFASDSLIVEDFVEFTKELFKHIQANSKIGKLVVFQQNPRDNPSLNKKWLDYKKNLDFLKSHDSYPRNMHFTYHDVLQSCTRQNPDFYVKCDLLKSF